MVPAILAAQPLLEGRPLFLHTSARNPDPSLRPSDTQSAILVNRTRDFRALPARDRYLIMRRRAVLLLSDEDEIEPPPAFDEISFSRFRDPQQWCEIQGECGVASVSDVLCSGVQVSF